MVSSNFGGLGAWKPICPKSEENANEWRTRPNPWIRNAGMLSNEGETSLGTHGMASFDLPDVEGGDQSPLPKWRNRGRGHGNLPITVFDWRIAGGIRTEAVEFRRKAQCGFSTESAKSLVEAGNALVRAAGGLNQAMRRSRERDFRLAHHQRQVILNSLASIHRPSDEMMETIRVGVTGNYARRAPSSPSRKGLPYRSVDTSEIVGKFFRISKMGACSYVEPKW